MRSPRIANVKFVRSWLESFKAENTFADFCESIGMKENSAKARARYLREKGVSNGERKVPIRLPELSGENVSSRNNADELLGILEEFAD